MSMTEFFVELKEACEDVEKAAAKAKAESKRLKNGRR